MPEEQQDNARDRIRTSFFGRPGRGHWIVAGLLFVLGFAAATQVARQSTDDLSGLRQTDLVRAFDGLAASTERAEKEIDRLKSDRDRLKTSTSSRETAVDLARQEETALGILSGTVAAHGPGVRITITDPDSKVSAAILLDMVQELRATGAEAMEFNDRVRVVAQTSFEDSAEGIRVGGELVTAPYVIDVIGESSALEGALDFPFGPVERVEDAGGTLTTTKDDDIVVDAVVPVGEPKFAQPDTDR
ncbi:DUF881 domain-containing protein [Nocardioides jiangxiensis]|uniref:DUF881 domain-containing protein n=1 Tax=Nocardioides jiangxiensis TaxID=3064524 RepID=A0ABT9AWI6_9ACTN|nr:DUF881 domain-containing protein [Nocardioides sp. WY-20]MDO7866794.1 DUF881 domain-containing protein [Nocardioides sp. WY-20]